MLIRINFSLHSIRMSSDPLRRERKNRLENSVGGMARPKLILDTNVCGKLLTPAYSSDLERIKGRINRTYRVVISPETFIELLETIRGGDGSHFETDRDRLRLMSGGGKPTFLEFPGAFVVWKVLGLKSTVTRFGPADFERWFRLVLIAKSRDQMINGLVDDPRSSRISYRFSPERVTAQQNSGKAAHRRQLEKTREAGETRVSGIHWAAGIAKAVGHSLTSQQATRLLESLDAAFHYRNELQHLVCKGEYNFDKHSGDWVDWQQLFYLCDPHIHVLTDDVRLKKRVGDSPQGERILVLRDFLSALGFAPQH
jgi:hypothetical protein